MTTLSHSTQGFTQGIEPWLTIREAAGTINGTINDVLVPALGSGAARTEALANATRQALQKGSERLSFKARVQASMAIWRQPQETPLVLTPSCVSDRPGVAVVAHPGDLVAHMVSTFLRYDDIPVWDINPHQLADVQYQVRPDALYIQGNPVSGVMLRWSRCPEKAGAGSTSDQHCGDPLVIASWLAAAYLGPTRLVNNYDSESWRGGTGWAVWERRLSESGVPTLQYGQPAGRTQNSLVVCGDVVAGPDGDSIRATADMLRSSGVELATVTTLPTGAVSAIETQPNIQNARFARRAAVSIIEHMAA